MRTAAVSTVALLVVLGGLGACDKKSSAPPPPTSDAGGGTDGGAGTDAGTDAGTAQDAGNYCIRQNCVSAPDCIGVGPDGGNYNCLVLPTNGSGNYCQRVCVDDGGTCSNGQVCRSGRCTEADCTPGGCGVAGVECRSLAATTSMCLPPCSTADDCCSAGDVECLANIDCVGSRCTSKTCTQDACDTRDAGLTCTGAVMVFPTAACTSACDNTAECTAAAVASNQTEKFVCQ